MSKILFSAALLFAATLYAAPATQGKTAWPHQTGRYEFTASTNCPDAVAKVGDTVKITILVKSPEPGYCKITSYRDGIALGKPRLAKFGESAELSFEATRPGSVSVECAFLDENRKPLRLPGRKVPAVRYFGVLIEPEKIVPGNPV